MCHVRIPMENAVARAVMRVVAHVMVKSGLLDFCGLILIVIVSVFNIVVFEAMEMRVMGCHLGEVGIGGAPERLWENEAERNATSGGLAFGLVHSGWREGGWESGRGEGCQKAMDVWDGGKRCGERLELSKGPAHVFGEFPGEESGLAIEWGHVEFGAYLDVVGKDAAVLGPDIVRGILEEEVNVFNGCGQR